MSGLVFLQWGGLGGGGACGVGEVLRTLVGGNCVQCIKIYARCGCSDLFMFSVLVVAVFILNLMTNQSN